MSRGDVWLKALSVGAEREWQIPSVRYADVEWKTGPVRIICVVPNPEARFPRARDGQFGIEEGWAVASCIREAMEKDVGRRPRAIVAVVDVPGQAFGFREEALGLHESLAASVDAYASARNAGHPAVALVVGKAISGAFLAHGLQAGAVLALDDSEVEIHVMSATSVARVTKRTKQEVLDIENSVPATARDVHSFAGLGAIDRLLKCEAPDAPSESCVADVRSQIEEVIEELRKGPRQPRDRLDSVQAGDARRMSLMVRAKLEEKWG